MKSILVNLRRRSSLTGLILTFFVAADIAVAQLPPTIEADRYLVQAERELANGNAAAAVETIDLILALRAEHGFEIRDEVWFRRAQAAYETELHDLAVESVVRYFEVSGQRGEHYLDALELYDSIELAKTEADGFAAAAAALARAVDAIAPEMVAIPAGRFRMGCVSGRDCYDWEFPVHDVTIPRAFAVSKHEVTVEEWDACVASGGCGGHRRGDAGRGRGNRPVVSVSWEDARAYVAWLSQQTGRAYRLLTEAEWEYVSRAGSSTAYSWGNLIGSNRANCQGCGSRWDANRTTAPVGSFPPNAFGVHDMHGNVWEWVEDCWNHGYEGAPSDGSAWRSGDCEMRVLRGGSWYNYPGDLRSAFRFWLAAGDRDDYSGFRVARTLTP